MNRVAKIGLLGLMFGAVAPAAHAQSTQPVIKPTSIKLGIYLPADSGARSQGGSTQFSAGIDYAFSKSAANSPVLPLVYLDYQGGSHNGGHTDLYGVGVGFRAYPDRSNSDQIIPFYGAGIGVDFLNVNNGGQSKTNTQIGGKVQIGLEMNTGPFVEADYQVVPQKAVGIRDDGFDLMIGDRF